MLGLGGHLAFLCGLKLARARLVFVLGRLLAVRLFLVDNDKFIVFRVEVIVSCVLAL